jgi:NAD(P)-dependent dehydrogenase (short-subunit alcohol dehydrogenase family)
MSDKKDLENRVVLITGASRGIGYAASIEAAKRGAHVVAVARTVGGLEDLDDEIQSLGGAATLVPLDMLDYPAIDRLGQAIFERWGRLDGLIGNAAILGSITPVPHIDPDEFEKAFAINVTANFRLLRSFDLPLRKSDSGRVVMVSSGAAKSAKAYWGLYASTKAALDTMTKSYANEMANTTVRANIYYPPPTRTAMRAKAVPGEDPNTLPTPTDIAPGIVDMLSPSLEENGMIFRVEGAPEPI